MLGTVTASSDSVPNVTQDTPISSVWPYQSTEDITLDNEANLPSPQVNKDTGTYNYYYRHYLL